LISYEDIFEAYGILSGEVIRIFNLPFNVSASSTINDTYSVIRSPSPINTVATSDVEMDIHYGGSSTSSGYGFRLFGDYPISTYASNTIATYASTIFDYQVRLDITVTNDITKYVKITGTVSSSNGGVLGTTTISTLSATPISTFSTKTFDDSINAVTGSGTTFLTDFSTNSIMLANSEYLTVSGVSNNTFMVIARAPALPFTNVIAYKVA
jgi:hypothetical protein